MYAVSERRGGFVEFPAGFMLRCGWEDTNCDLWKEGEPFQTQQATCRGILLRRRSCMRRRQQDGQVLR
jgi:hypothetical protein